MLEEMEPGSKVIHGAKASTGQARPNSGLIGRASNCSGWEKLSLEEALASLERVLQLPSVERLICILQECRKEKHLAYSKRLHAYMRKYGLEAHSSVGNYLVPMLVECGSIADALQVFNRLVDPNVYSWTSLITGYIECGESEHALNLYLKMQEECVHPSKYTFVALLKACARLKNAERGQEIHTEISRKGLETDPFLGSILVDMYAKCGLPAKAREVLDKLPIRDVVSWTALIAGYAEQRLGEEALNCFKQMQLEGVSPNAVTFICSLKACSSIAALDNGLEIHAEIARRELEGDPFVGSTLVDMYAKCGSLAKSREVFDRLPVRDVVSWNALIAGYAEDGLGEEARDCYEQMQLDGVAPNASTFVCSLKACGSIQAIDKGREIHTQITRKGFERDLHVGNTLVDMYAKCNSLKKAREVFDKLPVRDVVSWNALITGYSEHGLGEEAQKCFEQMQLEGCSPNIVSWNALLGGYAQLGESEIVFHMLERMTREGIKPNGVTFLGVLTVCSHTGLVDKGREYFKFMTKDNGITPMIEHHNSMVDLVGRAGQINEAVAMVEMMPLQPDLAVWCTVLGACRNWGNVEIARQAFGHAVRLDDKDAAGYVLMSNIYADAHMQDEGELIEKMIVQEQPCKDCWAEVD